jgi:hypothetical protein
MKKLRLEPIFVRYRSTCARQDRPSEWSDNRLGGQGERYGVREDLTPGSPVNFRMRRHSAAMCFLIGYT